MYLDIKELFPPNDILILGGKQIRMRSVIDYCEMIVYETVANHTIICYLAYMNDVDHFNC